ARGNGKEGARRHDGYVEKPGKAVKAMQRFVHKALPLQVEKGQRNQTRAPERDGGHMEELEPGHDHSATSRRGARASTSRQSTSARSCRLAGTHMMSPANCWSSSGERPKPALVAKCGT